MIRELQIHDVGEVLLHEPGHDLTQRRGAQILALLDDVIVGRDGGDRRGVGGGAADALLLHGADQRRLRVAGGRLRELLVGGHLLELQAFALAERGQRILKLVALLVLCLLIDGGVAGELQLGVVGAEGVPGGIHVHGHVVIDGVCHLACGEAAPDQAIEPILLLCQVLADHLGRQVHVRGADGLVGVLRAGLGLEASGLAGIVRAAVAADDIVLRSRERVLGQAQGVGTHIGDEADAALPRDLHALVELLRDGHGAPRRHGQAAAGLLLQGGGDEGRRGRALLFAALDRRDRKGGVLRIL